MKIWSVKCWWWTRPGGSRLPRSNSTVGCWQTQQLHARSSLIPWQSTTPTWATTVSLCWASWTPWASTAKRQLRCLKTLFDIRLWIFRWPAHHVCTKITNLLCPLHQSLQSSSYNHFSAIYYLLLERVREHRSQQLSRQCGTWSQRPRSMSDTTSPEVSTATRALSCFAAFAWSLNRVRLSA